MPLQPQAQERFAIEVVALLRDGGYQALWAGGCVRDRLLRLTPQDYDVATNARPDQIRKLFGLRRTLAIGAAFGVISVLGSRESGPVEVATFRRDALYSDGRRPDAVEFCDAEEDARRRDFTINGLFYDPLKRQVIDYVGGQEDLRQKTIRAIGDADSRIGEDKLRMLRGIRFAATFDFSICPQTMDAIQRRAEEISVVSVERISAELKRMLELPRRARAARLLEESGLLAAMLPSPRATQSEDWSQKWSQAIAVLTALGGTAKQHGHFEPSLATLLRSCTADPRQAAALARHWRLSNDVVEAIEFLLSQESVVLTADQRPWSQLQPLLADRFAPLAVDFAEATARALGQPLDGIHRCRQMLQLPSEALNPPHLVTGEDLIQMGHKPGPRFKAILQSARDAQLDGLLLNRQQALEFLANAGG